MKRTITMCVVLAGAVFFISTMRSVRVEAQNNMKTDSTGLPKKTFKRGLAIAPVALDLQGKDEKRVGEGSFIVNTACVSCHTNPEFAQGGNPFFGQPEQINTENYLAGGARFGPFVSANITPDVESGMPAGLTLEQFVEVMRAGRDFKNRHPQFGPLLQVMPWPQTAKYTDDDLRNIYEYLSAIPHADPAQ